MFACGEDRSSDRRVMAVQGWKAAVFTNEKWFRRIDTSDG
jgi:hypothetical protein